MNHIYTLGSHARPHGRQGSLTPKQVSPTYQSVRQLDPARLPTSPELIYLISEMPPSCHGVDPAKPMMGNMGLMHTKAPLDKLLQTQNYRHLVIFFFLPQLLPFCP